MRSQGPQDQSNGGHPIKGFSDTTPTLRNVRSKKWTIYMEEEHGGFVFSSIFCECDPKLAYDAQNLIASKMDESAKELGGVVVCKVPITSGMMGDVEGKEHLAEVFAEFAVVSSGAQKDMPRFIKVEIGK